MNYSTGDHHPEGAAPHVSPIVPSNSSASEIWTDTKVLANSCIMITAAMDGSKPSLAFVDQEVLDHTFRVYQLLVDLEDRFENVRKDANMLQSALSNYSSMINIHDDDDDDEKSSCRTKLISNLNRFLINAPTHDFHQYIQKLHKEIKNAPKPTLPQKFMTQTEKKTVNCLDWFQYWFVSFAHHVNSAFKSQRTAIALDAERKSKIKDSGKLPKNAMSCSRCWRSSDVEEVRETVKSLISAIQETKGQDACKKAGMSSCAGLKSKVDETQKAANNLGTNVDKLLKEIKESKEQVMGARNQLLDRV